MMAKKGKPKVDLSNLGFDETLARLIQTDPTEVADTADKVKREDEEVSKYVRERRESIARGARRTNHRIRI